MLNVSSKRSQGCRTLRWAEPSQERASAFTGSKQSLFHTPDSIHICEVKLAKYVLSLGCEREWRIVDCFSGFWFEWQGNWLRHWNKDKRRAGLEESMTNLVLDMLSLRFLWDSQDVFGYMSLKLWGVSLNWKCNFWSHQHTGSDSNHKSYMESLRM